MTPDTLNFAPRNVLAPQSNLLTAGRAPRILIVTPELGRSAFLEEIGKPLPCSKGGGLAEVAALLLDMLTHLGAEVHIALPHYRGISEMDVANLCPLIHLCEDREFNYRQAVYEGDVHSNLNAALAFQKDVIHYLLPQLRPDVVHCHDWMTGLVPAAARKLGIPSIFTVHNIHDTTCTLGQLESRGIDAAKFWDQLYFQNYPSDYETVRNTDPLSLLASGILAADRMTTVSPSFLGELASGCHGVGGQSMEAVRGKLQAGHAKGILNGLPNGISPNVDVTLPRRFGAHDHSLGKRASKVELQQALGLIVNPNAPLFFWPSRLDPFQKGCQLLSDQLYKVINDYWDTGLQIVFVADGPFQGVFEDIVQGHGLSQRVAVRGFHEDLSRLAYAASDFTLMPSAYEPCGLAQMAAMRYGSLPIVHRTGGLGDTVSHLDPIEEIGNGFVFEHHDVGGLRWAIDEAIRFYRLEGNCRDRNIERVMSDAELEFAPMMMAQEYMELFRSLARRDAGQLA